MDFWRAAALRVMEMGAALSLVPLLLTLLNDPSPDVKRRALDASRRFGRYGGAFARSAPASGPILPALTAVVNKETPNYVLRNEADRALTYWLDLKREGAGGRAPDGLLAAVDGETARFLTDYARRGLHRMAEEAESDEEEGTM